MRQPSLCLKGRKAMPRAGKVPLTLDLHKQTLTFAGAVLAQLPMVSEERQQHYIGKPDRLKKVLAKAFAEDLTQPSATADLLRWEMVYGKLFGLKQKPDLSALCIPEKPKGVGPVRLIVVAHEIVDWTKNRPLQGVQEALKKHFPAWQYEKDLDTAIPKNDRDPKNGSYAVWVKDVREADEEYANKLADDLKAENHAGITILERQLLETDYFFEKGEHLDRENWTLCLGSRSRDGNVPFAYWCDSKFGVYWFDSTNRDPNFRSRRVWV